MDKRRHTTSWPLGSGPAWRRMVTAALLGCLSLVTNGRTWTIGTGGDFVDINAAMSSSSVVDGDELQMLPKTVIYTAQTVTKAVTITGTGYLNDDESRQDRTNDYDAYFVIESDDVTIRSYRMGWVKVHGENVRLEHCYIDFWISQDSSNYDTDNTVIHSCFVGYGVYGYQMFAVIHSTGWTITNCIIGGRGGAYKLINLEGATIDHNILYSPYRENTFLVNSVKSSTLTNNIIVCDGNRDKTFDTTTLNTANGNTIRNNIVSNTSDLSGFPDNVRVTGLAQVCTLEGGDATSDVYYRLLASSPATGYATDGGDCGPWSGASPYVVGGIGGTTSVMEGNYKLDLNATDNASAGVFQSLLSLFTAMGTQGIGANVSVSVADGVYNLVVSDTTYPVLQAMAAQVLASAGTVAMAATNSATFNFTVDATFLLLHASELSTIAAGLKSAMERITLTNITVLFNGKPIIYDEFQVEANDLLALKNMYQAWGGDGWTPKRWSFESNGRSRDDFPGVTFDDNGRVTAIDLENNNLVGHTFLISSPQLSEVTSLNLSRNRLTGDVTPLVGSMTRLQTLNLSYNRLAELSEPSAIASTCSTVNLRCQNRVWDGETAEDNLPFTDNFRSLLPVIIQVSRTQPTISVPSLFTYEWEKLIYLRNTSRPTETFGEVYAYDELSLSSPYRVYSLKQDTLVAMVFAYGTYKARNSAYPAILRYTVGDADMNGATNVLDVQHTLNYILSPSTVGYFNFSAADTYRDNLINVQDIVKTVGLVLDQQPEVIYLYSRRAEAAVSDASVAGAADGTVYVDAGRIVTSATRPIAALDIQLQGVTTDEVGLLLPQRDFQMIGRNTADGCRFVIFSPTGQSVPADTATPLLRLSAAATVVAIQCSDPGAQEVPLAIGAHTTGISSQVREPSADADAMFDLNGRRVDASSLRKGVYVSQGRKVVVR